MSFNFKNKINKIDQKVSYGPGKRHLSKIYWYVLVILIISPFAYIAYNIISDNFFMKASGNIVFDTICIRSPQDGYIKDVSVKLGEKVEKNQVLVELENPSLDKELSNFRNEIITLQNKKSEIINDPRIIELDQMKQVSLQYIEGTKKYLETMADLRKRGVGLIQDERQARYDYNDSIQQLKETERKIAEYTLEHKIKIETQFDKNIREIQDKISVMETMLEYLKIKAPEEGSVSKLLIEKKEYVKNGQDLLIVTTKNNIHVEAYITARFLSTRISKGNEVTVVLPEGTRIKGRITKDSSFAEQDPTISRLVRDEKNKVFLYITLEQEIPVEHKIHNLPVEVLF